MVFNESYKDIDAIKPVQGGFSVTFDNIIAQINKVVQTIINQFSNVDNDIQQTEKKMQGVSGTYSEDSITVPPSTKQEFVIYQNNSRYLAHGCIRAKTDVTRTNTYEHIGRIRSSVSIDNMANRHVELRHPNDSATTLVLVLDNTGVGSSSSLTLTNLLVDYELY